MILCIGETLEEREGRKDGGRARAWQLPCCIRTVWAAGASPTCDRITIAYEPVWAIGTGQVATPEQAGAVHDYLRGVLAGLFDEATADACRIQYGGSVKPENIDQLMAVPGIDGALVGGAALQADSFRRIIEHS